MSIIFFCSGENQRVKRKVAGLRLFCDICDEFDLHDTEDCPQQASSDSPPRSLSDKPKVKPPPRPYCESCESMYLCYFSIFFYKIYYICTNRILKVGILPQYVSQVQKISFCFWKIISNGT